MSGRSARASFHAEGITEMSHAAGVMGDWTPSVLPLTAPALGWGILVTLSLSLLAQFLFVWLVGGWAGTGPTRLHSPVLG